jgi:hypothetical protein
VGGRAQAVMDLLSIGRRALYIDHRLVEKRCHQVLLRATACVC